MVLSGRRDERDMSTCAIFTGKVLPTPKDFHQIFSLKTFHQKLREAINCEKKNIFCEIIS